MTNAGKTTLSNNSVIKLLNIKVALYEICQFIKI